MLAFRGQKSKNLSLLGVIISPCGTSDSRPASETEAYKEYVHSDQHLMAAEQRSSSHPQSGSSLALSHHPSCLPSYSTLFILTLSNALEFYKDVGLLPF